MGLRVCAVHEQGSVESTHALSTKTNLVSGHPHQDLWEGMLSGGPGTTLVPIEAHRLVYHSA